MILTHKSMERPLSRIEALAQHYGNLDSIAMRNAERNLRNHVPAFWSMRGRGDSVGAVLLDYANEHQGIVAAWSVMERHYGEWHLAHYRTEGHLDKLLPLNAQGVAALAAAYLELGSWRNEVELGRRTDRAEAKA